MLAFIISILSQYNANVFAQNFNRASYYCYDPQDSEQCSQALAKLERSPAGSQNPLMVKKLEQAQSNREMRRILDSAEKIPLK